MKRYLVLVLWVSGSLLVASRCAVLQAAERKVVEVSWNDLIDAHIDKYMERAQSELDSAVKGTQGLAGWVPDSDYSDIPEVNDARKLTEQIGEVQNRMAFIEGQCLTCLSETTSRFRAAVIDEARLESEYAVKYAAASAELKRHEAALRQKMSAAKKRIAARLAASDFDGTAQHETRERMLRMAAEIENSGPAE